MKCRGFLCKNELTRHDNKFCPSCMRKFGHEKFLRSIGKKMDQFDMATVGHDLTDRSIHTTTTLKRKKLMHLSLSPAFGRDYKSIAAVTKDWKEDKDFVVNNPGHGTYINRSQALQMGIKTVWIRYAKLRKQTEVKV